MRSWTGSGYGVEVLTVRGGRGSCDRSKALQAWQEGAGIGYAKDALSEILNSRQDASHVTILHFNVTNGPMFPRSLISGNCLLFRKNIRLNPIPHCYYEYPSMPLLVGSMHVMVMSSGASGCSEMLECS